VDEQQNGHADHGGRLRVVPEHEDREGDADDP
jgi:hypothetical protein